MSNSPPPLLQPNIPPNGLTVLSHRYLLRDAQGAVCETPADLFWRVARHVAAGERAYGATSEQVTAMAHQFYNLMAQLAFLPNSPTLLNAGRPLGQLSACFVLPIEDSLERIFETLKHAALIHQSGGGTGFCFSKLRPVGDEVRETQSVAAGPVGFLEVYNAAVDSIKQAGQRKGANMALLRVDHPDVEAFISAKDDLRRVTNFNISIGITDAFMRALAEDRDFDLIHPNTGLVSKTLPARELMARIVDCAWRTGEPGLIFLARVNRDNPTPALGTLEATNPCGEVPLLPYEACNLGSINLMQMLNDQNQLDWQKLAETVHWAVRFLDNVITVNRYPLPQTEAMVTGNRKIGLGVMGWADCLMAQGIPYDSEAAVALAHELAAWIDYQAKLASVALAEPRGAFPNFPKSRYVQADWLLDRVGAVPVGKVSIDQWQALAQRMSQLGLRNATTTCIAPTGTISMIAGVSGGIEPVFALAFTRTVLNGQRLSEVHPVFAKWVQHHAMDPQAIFERVQATGRLDSVFDGCFEANAAHLLAGHNTAEGLPEPARRVFVTSFDVAPTWHIRMQAAFQAFTDNGVSKTINLPESATPEDVAQAFRLAYESGIKGVTVYRNNSRQDQPLSVVVHAPESAENDASSCQNCH
ncbi:adenosylcobalamin-dependent ribonucleoside-diphosphate reductase [Vampirovibrio chlorellavorus]|uniref:adenosylcobalamin-dependent ribonucleoside-diphosphate reductase n=1 Tax=Vampirovibrio chlorellavorus TaxID=758823 RepID=UPI0026EADCC9|nr:adenosylcobalamin-dependent ribonucleoside-diphosphate reductase [Vampirovibrio chlorellavorus]